MNYLKILKISILASFCLLFIALPAKAEDIVEEEFCPSTGTSYIFGKWATAGAKKYGERWFPGHDYTITGIYLAVMKVADTAPSGRTVRVNLYSTPTDSNNLESGTLLASSQSVEINTFVKHPSHVDNKILFIFDNPIELTSDTEYAWVARLSHDTEYNAKYFHCGGSSNPISKYVRNSSWESSSKLSSHQIMGHASGPQEISISSPEQDDAEINDSWITVSGECPLDGENRIGLTNSCTNFENITYDIDCTDQTFTAQFFKSGVSDWIVARDTESESTDCVDYDELMDVVEVDGFDVIEGYPDDWNFNYDYYDDYDIQINSPIFDTALTLPLNATSTDISYGFVYPEPLPANLVFNVKQYDDNGVLLDGAYHNINLNSMSDTFEYSLNMVASSTSGLHYVVQLIDDGELKRQYPFGIYVSDYEVVINPTDYDYLFPRLAEELKTKVIFNYFFAFYDNFQELFSASSTASSTALDISFKSVSDNGEYDLDVPIFKPSESIIQTIMQDFRPYLVAFLWVGFAIYLFVRVVQKDDDI